MKNIVRRFRSGGTIGSLSVAALMLLPGCVTYAPQELAAMSPIELCALEAEQRVNLSADTRRTLQAELQRRKLECARYATELEMRREARMHELTYSVHDDP